MQWLGQTCKPEHPLFFFSIGKHLLQNLNVLMVLSNMSNANTITKTCTTSICKDQLLIMKVIKKQFLFI